MKCPKCNKTINKNAKVCKYCNARINKKNNSKKVEIKNSKWLIALTIILTIIVLIESTFGIWYFLKINNYLGDNTKIVFLPNMNIMSSIKTYNMDETFIFDDLKITVNNDYSFVKLENIYSKYNGREVVKVPVTIKNISDKEHSLNLYYYNLYNQNGTVIDEVAAYFDESLFYAEDLKPDEEYTKYLYFTYQGDGTYSITFKNKEDNITVPFIIKKRFVNSKEDNSNENEKEEENEEKTKTWIV